MTDLEEVTLETLAGGVAGELFGHEWDRLLENTQDLNTKATAKRAIVLTVEVVPSDDRSQMTVAVKAVSKLAPVKPANGVVFIGKKNGRLVGAGFNPAQTDAFRDTDGVKPIERARAAQES